MQSFTRGYSRHVNNDVNDTIGTNFNRCTNMFEQTIIEQNPQYECSIIENDNTLNAIKEDFEY